MGDRHFKRILRRYKKTRIYRRRPMLFMLRSTTLSFGSSEALVCRLHPTARWVQCQRRHWDSHFCMGCHGSICPRCGRQVKVKQRFKSRR